jgi:hypothetical protein
LAPALLKARSDDTSRGLSCCAATILIICVGTAVATVARSASSRVNAASALQSPSMTDLAPNSTGASTGKTYPVDPVLGGATCSTGSAGPRSTRSANCASMNHRLLSDHSDTFGSWVVPELIIARWGRSGSTSGRPARFSGWCA